MLFQLGSPLITESNRAFHLSISPHSQNLSDRRPPADEFGRRSFSRFCIRSWEAFAVDISSVEFRVRIRVDVKGHYCFWLLGFCLFYRVSKRRWVQRGETVGTICAKCGCVSWCSEAHCTKSRLHQDSKLRRIQSEKISLQVSQVSWPFLEVYG